MRLVIQRVKEAKVEVDGNIFAKGSLTFTKIPKDSVYKR